MQKNKIHYILLVISFLLIIGAIIINDRFSFSIAQISKNCELKINEKMMSLKDPIMSGQIKLQIQDMFSKPINLLHRNDFIMLYNG